MRVRRQGSPPAAHVLKKSGFRLFKFRPVEGIKVVYSEIGFGHFGEEFLLVGEGVVAGQAAFNVERFVVFVGFPKGLPGPLDFLVFKTQNLVVVGVG